MLADDALEGVGRGLRRLFDHGSRVELAAENVLHDEHVHVRSAVLPLGRAFAVVDEVRGPSVVHVPSDDLALVLGSPCEHLPSGVVPDEGVHVLARRRDVFPNGGCVELGRAWVAQSLGQLLEPRLRGVHVDGVAHLGVHPSSPRGFQQTLSGGILQPSPDFR